MVVLLPRCMSHSHSKNSSFKGDMKSHVEYTWQQSIKETELHFPIKSSTLKWFFHSCYCCLSWSPTPSLPFIVFFFQSQVSEMHFFAKASRWLSGVQPPKKKKKRHDSQLPLNPVWKFVITTQRDILKIRTKPLLTPYQCPPPPHCRATRETTVV